MYYWLYASSTVHGPYTRTSLGKFLDEDLINARSLAWRRNLQEWTSLRDVLLEEPSQEKTEEKRTSSTSRTEYLHLCRKGIFHGPYSASAVAKYLKEGDFRTEDLVWRRGMGNWGRLKDLRQHFTLPASAQHPITKEPFRIWIARNGKVYGPYPASLAADWVGEGRLLPKDDYAYPSDHRIWVKLDDVRQVGMILYNREQNSSIPQPRGIGEYPLPKSWAWHVIDSGFKETAVGREE